ncbi:MAG: hypothetical protein IPN76_35050 [Saprospiraceae bacterium]|nr:hypothetical protein [Saprospiraceae bacterium]
MRTTKSNADIEETDTVTLAGQQYYGLDACGENAVLFTNESRQQQFISEFRWEFDINGTTEVSTIGTPIVNFYFVLITVAC